MSVDLDALETKQCSVCLESPPYAACPGRECAKTIALLAEVRALRELPGAMQTVRVLVNSTRATAGDREQDRIAAIAIINHQLQSVERARMTKDKGAI